MTRRGAYVAAGLAAFFLFLVAMVPAGQVARRLPREVVLDGVAGTIWSGTARALTVQGHPVGALEWSCRPWRLVFLEWSCNFDVHPSAGTVSGELSGDFRGSIVGRHVRGRIPIGAFAGIATPRGWTGDLELDLDELHMESGRPRSAAGRLFLRGLRGPGASGQRLGDFELVVGAGSVGGEALSGRLRDLGGPLHVRGVIELSQDGRYLLSGDAAPGPGAGPAIFDTLDFLGPPDGQGRRPFTVEGTL